MEAFLCIYSGEDFMPELFKQSIKHQCQFYVILTKGKTAY